MARFLIVCPPLVGHVNPTIAVGQELARRGHQVAWSGYPDPLALLLPPGAELVPAGPAVPSPIAEAARRSLGLRGAAALQFLWEGFLAPLARAMVPGVERAVDRLRPDALLVDQQALAGAIVAKRRQLPWATSATTSGELVDPFSGMPKVSRWISGLLRGLQVDHGVRPDQGAADLRFSDHLVIAFTTPELAGPDRPFPEHWAFVGPSVGQAGDDVAFPFDWLDDDRRRVLLSLGTVNAHAGGRFFSRAIEALDGSPVQAVVVAPPDLVGDVPANVLVRSRVPQLRLMAGLDAVVCHGGHNTVCEALLHAVPLVVAPIRDDQPIVADQVLRAGAGIRLKFARFQPQELRASLTAVLEEPGYRLAAGRIGASFRAAGGAPAAASRLEALA